jgi:hypothetical protein
VKFEVRRRRSGGENQKDEANVKGVKMGMKRKKGNDRQLRNCGDHTAVILQGGSNMTGTDCV